MTKRFYLTDEPEEYIDFEVPENELSELFEPNWNNLVVDVNLIVDVHYALSDGHSPYSGTTPDDVARWLGQHLGQEITCETL